MKPFFSSLSYLAALLVGTVSAYAATPIQTTTIPLNAHGEPIDLVVTPDGNEVYVSIENGKVVLIDTSSNQITSTLDTNSSFPPGSGKTIVSSLDGSEIYIAAFDLRSRAPKIKVINTSTKAISTISLPSGNALTDMKMNPNGSELYVVDTYSTLLSINTTTKAVTSIDTTKTSLISSLFSPDGTKAYILSAPPPWVKWAVCVIDTASNTLITTIDAGFNTTDLLWDLNMAMSSDGSRLYFFNSPYNPTKGSVSVIDTNSNELIDKIEVGIEPSAIATIPNQPKVYAVNYPNPDISTVSVIDTSSGEVTNEIAVGLQSAFIELTPDGSIAYVSNSGSNSVSVIDTNADEVLYTVQTGEGPSFIVVTPDGTTAYILNIDDESVTTFNISATSISHASDLGTSFLLRSAQGLTSTEFFAALAWDTSPGAISYKIYRDGVLIATLPAGTTKYRDHNLDPNRTYTYTLDAVTEHGTIHYDFWQRP